MYRRPTNWKTTEELNDQGGERTAKIVGNWWTMNSVTNEEVEEADS